MIAIDLGSHSLVSLRTPGEEIEPADYMAVVSNPITAWGTVVSAGNLLESFDLPNSSFQMMMRISSKHTIGDQKIKVGRDVYLDSIKFKES